MFQPKVSKTEFEAAMLPSTRREVFFDVLKLHFSKLSLCGMISLAFTLPFLFMTMARDGLEAALYGSGAQGAEALVQLTTYENLFALLEVPCFALLSVGLAGLSRAVKRFAWEEPVRVGADFAKGVSQNWKQYLLLGLLTGLAVFVCRYGMWAMGGGFKGLLPAAMLGLALGPVAAYLSVTIAVYDLPFFGHIKYALLLYGKNAPKTLLVAGLCLLPFVPQFLPNIYCHTIGRLLSGMFIPIIMLAWFLFAFSCLDKDINPKHYPELVDQGLLGKGGKRDG